MEQKENTSHWQDIADHHQLHFYKLQIVFVPIVKFICPHCMMYFHLNTLIHFQYESSLRFMEQKEEAVFHRQTPPEYHKIAKKKSKLECHKSEQKISKSEYQKLSSREDIRIKISQSSKEKLIFGYNNMAKEANKMRISKYHKVAKKTFNSEYHKIREGVPKKILF